MGDKKPQRLPDFDRKSSAGQPPVRQLRRKITAFEQGIVAGIGSQVVGLQGVEDFANFLKLLMVRRYGLEGMTGEQIGLGQL